MGAGADRRLKTLRTACTWRSVSGRSGSLGKPGISPDAPAFDDAWALLADLAVDRGDLEEAGFDKGECCPLPVFYRTPSCISPMPESPACVLVLVFMSGPNRR